MGCESTGGGGWWWGRPAAGEGEGAVLAWPGWPRAMEELHAAGSHSAGTRTLVHSFTHSLPCQPAHPLSWALQVSRPDVLFCLFFLPHMSSLRHKSQSHALGSQGA